MADLHGWAESEFGHAVLGDTRRARRLVEMAATVAARPGGKVTEVFEGVAAREAAFRLIENEDIEPGEIARAAHIATAVRAQGERFAWVPIDGSSLNITDRTGKKGLGAVGARSAKARGLCVMSAIAVAPSGTPLGLCGQRYWSRVVRSTRRNDKNDKRRVEEKETRYWLDVMGQVRSAFEEHAPGVRPWYQLDRGGDAWPVLLTGAPVEDHWFTVRSAYNRRVRTKGRKQRYLWDVVAEQPVLGVHHLDVSAGHKRQARTARLTIQSCAVTLDLRDQSSKQAHEAALHAVLVREVSTTPKGEKPIEWLLLTNYRVDSLSDALLVIHGYSQRWRIEEFHKTWKTGACNVEDNQLRAEDHVVRWATILASVAARILRLTYLARATPNAPALVELSKAELQAVLLLRKPKRDARTRATIAEAVLWLAQIGGYTGKSSGGPPGALVIARGLRRIEAVAALLADGSLSEPAA
jgi:hypothetical protein